MTTKVFWTSAERETVLTRALYLHRTSGYSPYESIKRAQEQLPVTRRRNLQHQSSCTDLIRELKKRAYDATDVKRKAPAVEPSPVVASDATPVTLEQTFDGLVRALAEKFADVLKQEVKRAVLDLEREFKTQKHNPEQAQTIKVARPRIIVIGLLGDQVKNIDHEFGSVFDLKFIDTDRAMGLTPPDADAYLLMKNFINHPLYHRYRGFDNHVLIDGGMTSLRTWLHSKANQIIAESNENAIHH